MAGFTIADLTAMFGIEVDEASWDAAKKTFGQTEEALKDLVKQFVKTGKVKLPPMTDPAGKGGRGATKKPLSDTEEAMKIVDAKLKRGRIDALLATTDINKAISTIGFPGAPGMKGKPGEKVEEASAGFLSTMGKVRLATLGVGYAVIQTSRRLIGMGESSIEAASQIHDQAISTGISTSALQEMKFAADQSGSSLEALIAGSKRLNLAVDQARTHGAGPAAKALKDLGLSAAGVQKVIKEGGLDAGMTLVSEKLAKIQDPAQRSRIAIALLGKAGQSLLPTLTDLASLREDARALGGILPESDINAMEDFGDQMGRVKFALGGLLNQLVAALIPALKQITDGILAWMSANREVIATNLQSVVDSLVASIDALIAVTGVIASAIGLFVDESDIAVTALQILTAIMAIFGITAMIAWIQATWPILLIIAAVGILVLAIRKMWDLVQRGSKLAALGIAILLGPLGLVALGIMLLIKHWDDIKSAFSRAWSAIISGLGIAWGAIKRIGLAFKNLFVETIPNALRAAWDAVWDAIIDGARAAWEKFKNLPVIGMAIDIMASDPNAGVGEYGDISQFSPQPFVGADAGMAVSPSAVGGWNSSVQIDNINVTSPNADPKQVGAAIKPAMREFMDDELRKAKK